MKTALTVKKWGQLSNNKISVLELKIRSVSFIFGRKKAPAVKQVLIKAQIGFGVFLIRRADSFYSLDHRAVGFVPDDLGDLFIRILFHPQFQYPSVLLRECSQKFFCIDV